MNMKDEDTVDETSRWAPNSSTIRQISASCVCSRAKSSELNALGEGTVVVCGASDVEDDDLEEEISSELPRDTFGSHTSDERGFFRGRSVMPETIFVECMTLDSGSADDSVERLLSTP